jgi:SAM-dependent methyltransferase
MALRARNLAKFAGAAVATVAGGYVLIVSNRDLELKVDAWLLDKTLSAYNEIASVKKSVHLAPLRHTPCLSGDESVKSRGKFRLVDVGCGTGVNAPFYPREAVVTGVDPNMQFEPYFRQKMAQSLVEIDRYLIGKCVLAFWRLNSSNVM